MRERERGWQDELRALCKLLPILAIIAPFYIGKWGAAKPLRRLLPLLLVEVVVLGGVGVYAGVIP